ncbi:hypothetical protein CSKR_105286, partial [Clonorchis sinensis]
LQRLWGEISQRLEWEFTGRIFHSSKQTFASRLPLFRLEQTVRFPTLVLPSNNMSVRHRMDATTERFRFLFIENPSLKTSTTSTNSSTSAWIVSGAFSDCISTMHTKGRDDFGQFIQKHLRLLLFEDENDVVCILQLNNVFFTGYLNTRVLETLQRSSHYLIDHEVEKEWRECASLTAPLSVRKL